MSLIRSQGLLAVNTLSLEVCQLCQNEKKKKILHNTVREINIQTLIRKLTEN